MEMRLFGTSAVPTDTTKAGDQRERGYFRIHRALHEEELWRIYLVARRFTSRSIFRIHAYAEA